MVAGATAWPQDSWEDGIAFPPGMWAEFATAVGQG